MLGCCCRAGGRARCACCGRRRCACRRRGRQREAQLLSLLRRGGLRLGCLQRLLGGQALQQAIQLLQVNGQACQPLLLRLLHLWLPLRLLRRGLARKRLLLLRKRLLLLQVRWCHLRRIICTTDGVRRLLHAWRPLLRTAPLHAALRCCGTGRQLPPRRSRAAAQRLPSACGLLLWRRQAHAPLPNVTLSIGQV